jgi:hypothetical protein
VSVSIFAFYTEGGISVNNGVQALSFLGHPGTAQSARIVNSRIMIQEARHNPRG